jgi:hypothetical protein
VEVQRELTLCSKRYSQLGQQLAIPASRLITVCESHSDPAHLRSAEQLSKPAT